MTIIGATATAAAADDDDDNDVIDDFSVVRSLLLRRESRMQSASSLARSAGRRLSEPSPQSSGIRRREGGRAGQVDGGSERLAHLPQSAGQLATRTEKGDVTRADTGRRTTGGRTGVRDAPLASERARPRPYFLPCLLSLAWPWPCPARTAARPWPSPRPRPSSRLCTYFCS